MPIQSTDTTSTVTVGADNENWIIAEHVNVAVGTDGVFDSHNHNLIQNFGHVLATFAIDLTGNFITVDNAASGTIRGSTYGIKSTGDVLTVQNAGTISSGSDAIYSAGSSLNLTNSGTITGSSTGVLDNGANAGDYFNTGLIRGGSVGIYLQTGAFTSANIVNSGTIAGDYNSIADEYLGHCAAQIRNSGSLDGTVDLSFATLESAVLNTGRIQGDMLFGEGSDAYDGRAGAITGLINGGAGNDLLRAGVGEDTLIGGAGRDRMDGGKGGDDTFVFTDVKDSRPAAADIITRHWDASDTIDMSAIEANTSLAGQQHFTFGGAVTPGASLTTGVVGYYVQNGDTYVVADVNGDHKADFQLVIHGAYTLTAGEFVL